MLITVWSCQSKASFEFSLASRDVMDTAFLATTQSWHATVFFQDGSTTPSHTHSFRVSPQLCYFLVTPIQVLIRLWDYPLFTCQLSTWGMRLKLDPSLHEKLTLWDNPDLRIGGKFLFWSIWDEKILLINLQIIWCIPRRIWVAYNCWVVIYPIKVYIFISQLGINALAPKLLLLL